MSWKDLDIKLKAELIKLGVLSGIRDINLIRLLYDGINTPILAVDLFYSETDVKPLLGIERIKQEYGIPEKELSKANAIMQLIKNEISLEKINNQQPVLFRLFNKGGYISNNPTLALIGKVNKFKEGGYSDGDEGDKVKSYLDDKNVFIKDWLTNRADILDKNAELIERKRGEGKHYLEALLDNLEGVNEYMGVSWYDDLAPHYSTNESLRNIAIKDYENTTGNKFDLDPNDISTWNKLGRMLDYIGKYHGYGNIVYNEEFLDNNPLETIIHERTHALNAHPLRFSIRNLNIQPLLEDKDEYWDNPDEVYSRLMEFRHANKLDPKKIYTIEDIKKFKEDSNVKDFEILNRYNEEDVLKLLNDIAYNQDSPIINMAKNGGYIFPKSIFLHKYAPGGYTNNPPISYDTWKIWQEIQPIVEESTKQRAIQQYYDNKAKYGDDVPEEAKYLYDMGLLPEVEVTADKNLTKKESYLADLQWSNYLDTHPIQIGSEEYNRLSEKAKAQIHKNKVTDAIDKAALPTAAAIVAPTALAVAGASIVPLIEGVAANWATLGPILKGTGKRMLASELGYLTVSEAYKLGTNGRDLLTDTGNTLFPYIENQTVKDVLSSMANPGGWIGIPGQAMANSFKEATKPVVTRMITGDAYTTLGGKFGYYGNTLKERAVNTIKRRLGLKTGPSHPEFLRKIDTEHLAIDKNGNIDILAGQRPNREFVNFTTDRPVVSHTSGDWDYMPELIINPAEFKSHTPISIEPSDTFFRKPQNMTANPKNTTLVSGNIEELNKARSIGMETLSSRKLRRLYKKMAESSDKKPNRRSNYRRLYTNEIQRLTNKRGNPDINDYKYMEELYGLKSGVVPIEDVNISKLIDLYKQGLLVKYPNNSLLQRKDPEYILKRGYNKVFYDPTSSVELDYIKKMSVPQLYSDLHTLGFEQGGFLFPNLAFSHKFEDGGYTNTAVTNTLDDKPKVVQKDTASWTPFNVYNRNYIESPIYEFDNFEDSFKLAKIDEVPIFIWNGRTYNTDLKPNPLVENARAWDTQGDLRKIEFQKRIISDPEGTMEYFRKTFPKDKYKTMNSNWDKDTYIIEDMYKNGALGMPNNVIVKGTKYDIGNLLWGYLNTTNLTYNQKLALMANSYKESMGWTTNKQNNGTAKGYYQMENVLFKNYQDWLKQNKLEDNIINETKYIVDLFENHRDKLITPISANLDIEDVINNYKDAEEAQSNNHRSAYMHRGYYTKDALKDWDEGDLDAAVKAMEALFEKAGKPRLEDRQKIALLLSEMYK